MKRVFKYLLIITIILFLGGCSFKLKELPSDPLRYETKEISTGEDEEYYQVIEYQSKDYVYYGNIKTRGLNNDYTYAFGNCLGYVGEDTNDRIYELKGYPSDNFVINYYVNGEMMEPVVLKSLDYNGDIPDIIEIDELEGE